MHCLISSGRSNLFISLATVDSSTMGLYPSDVSKFLQRVCGSIFDRSSVMRDVYVVEFCKQCWRCVLCQSKVVKVNWCKIIRALLFSLFLLFFFFNLKLVALKVVYSMFIFHQV